MTWAGTYTLDHLRAWNYNQNNLTARGLEQADIYYSTAGVGNNTHLSGATFDSSGWQTLVDDQTFTQASGGAAIENTDASILLPNVTATHVAIVVDSSFAGSFVGFAEMQIYAETTSNTGTSSLTVNSGTGSGVFDVGTSQLIEASPAAAGEVFLAWTGDTAGVADVSLASTTFTMQSADATITATYETLASSSTLIPPSQLSAISSSQYGAGDIADAFDGTGLDATGDNHGNNPYDGWLSANAGAAGQWVIVDLGGTYTLDHLRAWNYNQNNLTARGLEQADLYYSTAGVGNNTHLSGATFDSSGWQTLVDDQTFTQASGGAAIENTDASILLPNVTATHVAIVVDSSFAGSFVGFAEMQIYAETTSNTGTSSLTVNSGTGSGVFDVGTSQLIEASPAAAGEVFLAWTGDTAGVADVSLASTTFTMQSADATITATYETLANSSTLIPPSQLSAISSSQYGAGDIADAFDGTGLDATGDNHGNNPYDGWLSANAGAAGQWVIVDLGGTYTLDHLRAWNYNQNNLTARGLEQADLYYSTAGVGNNTHLSGATFDSSGWQTLVDNQTFIRSPGGTTIENTDASILLPNVTATHVAIVVDSSFGSSFVGFAEMQIYGAPASSALAASSSSDDGSAFTGLTLPSQQVAATDEALFLLDDEAPVEAFSGIGPVELYTADDLDDAFQQLGLLGQEVEEEEKEEFGQLLVTSGLDG